MYPSFFYMVESFSITSPLLPYHASTFLQIRKIIPQIVRLDKSWESARLLQ